MLGDIISFSMSITLRSERFRVRTVYEHGLAERRSSIDTAPSATREA